MTRASSLLIFFLLAVAVGLAWACGGDDSTPVTPADAGTDAADADASQDAGVADVVYPDVQPLPDIDGGPMCDPGKAFGAPTAIAELDTTGTEGSIRLSADQLTAYFASARPGGVGGVDLWIATRADAGAPFGNFQNLAPLNSTATDTHATVTADGLTLYFETLRGQPNQAVYESQRASTAAPFASPLSLPGFGGFAVVTDPYVRADGQVLYVSAGLTLADLDIYRLVMSGGSFGEPVSVGELNGQANEELPAITPNDRVLYMASTRVDSMAKGGYDIWLSVRSTINDPWSSPQTVPELNTNDDDLPDYISPDACTIYFHRTTVSSDASITKTLYVASKSM